MSSLFISDLHLKPDAPHIAVAAHQLLTTVAPDFDNLFILGDFVEYWLGDDAYDGSLEPVVNAIKALSDNGVTVRIMFGNRDFLFGERFAELLGATLITDDTLVFEDENVRLLLLHGDTLCTDDTAYQQMRLMLRNPQWQAEFLAKPIPERIQAAMQLREKSQQETRGKSMAIMDVNQQAVENLMQEHYVFDMLHGHTHRPDTHVFSVKGKQATRTVLGDWTDQGTYIGILRNGRLQLQAWNSENNL